MQTPKRPRSSLPHGGPVDVRNSNAFVNLAKKARERSDLDQRLRQTLPAALREQIRLADIRHGCLVFLAPSSAWASRLRLSQAQLLAKARAMGITASSVVVKVVPPPPPGIPEPPWQSPLSPATAKHLKTAASSLSDPELRDLFLALASMAQQSDSPDKPDESPSGPPPRGPGQGP